jgi:hypothetical protein
MCYACLSMIYYVYQRMDTYLLAEVLIFYRKHLVSTVEVAGIV